MTVEMLKGLLEDAPNDMEIVISTDLETFVSPTDLYSGLLEITATSGKIYKVFGLVATTDSDFQQNLN